MTRLVFRAYTPMPEQLKVMVVTYGDPYPPSSGVAIRDYNLLKQLSSSVTLHLCILATETSAPDLSNLSQFCASVVRVPATPRTLLRTVVNSLRCWSAGFKLASHPYFYPELAGTVRSLVRSENIDILQIEHSFLSAYQGAVPPGSRCRTILSLHNVGSRQYARIAETQSTVLARLSYAFKSFLIRRMESDSVGKFDRCLVVSNEEGRVLMRTAPAVKFAVVENGVDCGSIRRLPPSRHHKDLLFIGVINYAPNCDAILYFCKSILPLIRRSIPETHLAVVGHAPPMAVKELTSTYGITVTGFVDDPIPYYDDATVCVVPLRAGGGTRLKILEAMAIGRPVVTTSIGCEGLEVRDGEHLLVGDSAEDFADHVIRLLQDEGLRRRIIAAARALVEQRYDWSIIANSLLQTYHEVMTSI